MIQDVGPVGASSQGFVAGAAGPLLAVVAVVGLFAVPGVRSFLAGYLYSVREHFTPQPPQNAATSPSGGAVDASPQEQNTGRASDRDDYDFDLGVLAVGDACDVDAPPSS